MFRRRHRGQKHVKQCLHCHRAFEGRLNAVHCSAGCRKAAWRAKEKQEAKSLRALAVTLARAAGLRPEDFA